MAMHVFYLDTPSGSRTCGMVNLDVDSIVEHERLIEPCETR